MKSDGVKKAFCQQLEGKLASFSSESENPSERGAEPQKKVDYITKLRDSD